MYPLMFMLCMCGPAGGVGNPEQRSALPHITSSCTIFAIQKGGSVFFGNNEDWHDPDTFYWVKPPTDSTYGVLYVGYSDLYPQGGINEKGLAFDGNSLPVFTMKENPAGRKPTRLIISFTIMEQCATVSEAIGVARSYDWGGTIAGQVLLADASGDAVVMSADVNGELAFTRKPEGDGFIVSTNFNRANPSNRWGNYPCERYTKTEARLDSLSREDRVTVDALASVLDAVHFSGTRLNTLYSNIFDLKEGLVYLYFWHAFDHPVTLRVADVIARKSRPVRLSTLFPDDVAEREHSLRSLLLPILLILMLLMSGGFAYLLYRVLRRGPKAAS